MADLMPYYKKMVNVYKSKYELGDFTTANTNIDNVDFRPILKIQIPKKQIVAPGAGLVEMGVDLRETFKIDVKTAANANIPGKVRWVVKDANEANSLFGDEHKSSDAVTGVKIGVRADRAISEDAFLVLEYKSTASSAVIDFTKTTIEFPVTKQLINNLP